ncbi:MAG: hypothetical protein FJ253_02930 [Phycisphaerae bacterium]|nr:hypothetical protein [Phycisphaerae bacterium]
MANNHTVSRPYGLVVVSNGVLTGQEDCIWAGLILNFLPARLGNPPALRHDVPGWASCVPARFGLRPLIREGKIKMRKVLLGTGLIAAALTASANAAFLGYACKSDTVNVSGVDYLRIEVFAMFESNQEKVLNIFNSDISLEGATNFYHSGAEEDWSWAPSGTNAADSRVCIGPLSGGSVAGDPNFTNYNWDLGEDPSLPPAANAGWFTSNPNGGQNAAAAVVGLTENNTGSNLGVRVGRFSILAAGDTNDRRLNFEADIKYNLIGQTGSTNGFDSEVFKYVPTPGALALLGLAGFAGRRRRA